MPSAVGDQRTGARAAPGPDRHAVRLRPVDEVGDDQEVAGEAHLHDGLRSRTRGARGSAARLPRARRVRIQLLRGAAPGPSRASLPQVVVERDPCRASETPAAGSCRVRASRLQRLRDLDALASASGMSANSCAISACVLKYCSGVKQLRPALVGQHIALGDAHARLVRLEVLGARGTAPGASPPPAA